MKKLIFTSAVLLITTLGFSQSKYETAMKEKIDKVEQHLSADDFQKLIKIVKVNSKLFDK